MMMHRNGMLAAALVTVVAATAVVIAGRGGQPYLLRARFATVDGLKPRGKLLIVAAPFQPLSVSVFPLLSGKTIAGWPSGSAIDSEDAMAFSALTNVRPRIERFKLDQAEQAYAKVMENKVRFRAVLIP